MASTYSNNLKLELMETGANANTWGNNTNTNLQTLDAFAGGFLSKSVAGSANVTLTTANADPTAEASNKVLDLNGALTGDIHVFIPAVESNYLIYNNTSGSQTLTVAATGHAANGTAISQGGWHWVYCDGASNYNVTEAAFTTVNASALTEGTLADARLSANVVFANGATTITGAQSFTANVNLGDSNYINLGASSDMRIFHNGSNSLIDDQGTGSLLLRSNGDGVFLQNGDSTASLANFRVGTGNEFYYNNSKKLETTTGGIAVTGAITATGDITAFYTSDETLKTNIANIENPMEKVAQLNGVSYNWTEEAQAKYDHLNGDKEIGVIAQQVEKVLPEMVGTRDDGTKAVRYERMCALLIECVKDLQSQIDDLKKGN